MTGKKFEKKMDKASDRKLAEMYLDRMDYNPTTRSVEELRILSQKISDDGKDILQFAYYEERMKKLNNEKFRILTGYGQCRGNLVAKGSEIIMCCCREMAGLVAFQNAHQSGGQVHVPGEKGSAVHHGDSVFVIADEEGADYRGCPFCGAPLQIKFEMNLDDKEE